MSNPILQAMSQKTAINMPVNSILNNPNFKQFYEQNKNKTPEQVAREYGLDWNAIKQFMK